MNNNNPMNPQQVQGAYKNEGTNIKSLCRQLMNYHVIAQMRDGSQFDGILTDMDEESVTMLVPEMVAEEQADRQYGYNGYGYGYRRRFRRFRRRRFPFFHFLFPFFRPYPYYYGGYYY